MKSTTTRDPTVAPRVTACFVALLALAPMSHSLADDADCKPLFDAMNGLFNTPNHEYLSQTSAGTGDKSVDSEIINTGKAMYIRVDGKWRNSNATGALLQQQEEENRKKAKVTRCRLVHEETLDGVTVRLFSAHTETDYGASDEQIWIAKSNNLPVREIIEMDLGDHGGKSHAEIRVVYSGVEAPAVP